MPRSVVIVDAAVALDRDAVDRGILHHADDQRVAARDQLHRFEQARALQRLQRVVHLPAGHPAPGVMPGIGDDRLVGDALVALDLEGGEAEGLRLRLRARPAEKPSATAENAVKPTGDVIIAPRGQRRDAHMPDHRIQPLGIPADGFCLSEGYGVVKTMMHRMWTSGPLSGACDDSDTDQNEKARAAWARACRWTGSGGARTPRVRSSGERHQPAGQRQRAHDQHRNQQAGRC
jgi:hypothetical protein